MSDAWEVRKSEGETGSSFILFLTKNAKVTTKFNVSIRPSMVYIPSYQM